MNTAPSNGFAYALALTTETSILAVARRAYELWEAEGRPEGRNLEHWLQAETEIAVELAQAIARQSRAAAAIGTWTVAEPAKPADPAKPGP